jgi:hypothetical protein
LVLVQVHSNVVVFALEFGMFASHSSIIQFGNKYLLFSEVRRSMEYSTLREMGYLDLDLDLHLRPKPVSVPIPSQYPLLPCMYRYLLS